MIIKSNQKRQMIKVTYASLILILTLSGCAATSPKIAKEEPVPEPAPDKSIVAEKKITLDQQYREKGRNSSKEEKYDEALQYFLEAEKIKSDDKLLFNIGITLERLGRPEEALEYLWRCVYGVRKDIFHAAQRFRDNPVFLNTYNFLLRA